MNEHVIEIVDELYELGVEDIVLSPGARSTPLAILFFKHKFNIYMDIDERSAAFFALGIAKAKNKPVGLVCTSGSACAHYLPAAIEAKYSRIPLIFLTADRPSDIHNVGAPQTIVQANIFGKYAKYYEELNSEPKENIKNEVIATNQVSYPRLVMQKAFIHANSSPKSAVQINIPLKDPLEPNLENIDFSKGRTFKNFKLFDGEVDNPNFVDYFIKNSLGKKGLIICGPNSIKSQEYYSDILNLSKYLKAPVLADPLSQFRAFSHENIITSYDAFLKSETIVNELKVDYMLLIGQSPVSKRLFQFIQKQNQAEIYQLDMEAEYRNPAVNTANIVQVSENIFAKRLISHYLQEEIDCSYLEKWQAEEKKMLQILREARNAETIFEGKIIQLIQDYIMDFNSNLKSCDLIKTKLVLANSMTIRDVDFFWEAKEQCIEFYGNRGANGIDGTLSTALGISTHNPSSPTVLISGDLSFFHDLTGLLVGKRHDLNLTIILLNNNGGGIFNYLPQANIDNFEYLFLTPHDLNFEALAKLYSIFHVKIDSYSDFITEFTNALNSKGIKILEFNISMEESKRLHDKYTNPK